MADLTTNQVETLGVTSEVLADSAFTVLSMLLGREIDLIPLRSAYLNSNEVQELGWSKIIVARASFSRGWLAPSSSSSTSKMPPGSSISCSAARAKPLKTWMMTAPMP